MKHLKLTHGDGCGGGYGDNYGYGDVYGGYGDGYDGYGDGYGSGDGDGCGGGDGYGSGGGYGILFLAVPHDLHSQLAARQLGVLK